MKNIALNLMVVAFSMIISTTVVSAQSFTGVFEMMATGSCLHSEAGFNDDYTPKTKANYKVWSASTVAQGSWTFAGADSSASGMNYVIDHPPGGPDLKSPVVRSNPFFFPFTYTVDVSGKIVVTLPNGFELEGMVSQDLNTITMVTGFQFFPPPFGPVYCNTGRVLIRVADIVD